MVARTQNVLVSLVAFACLGRAVDTSHRKRELVNRRAVLLEQLKGITLTVDTPADEETNYFMIGGIVALGVVGLGIAIIIFRTFFLASDEAEVEAQGAATKKGKRQRVRERFMMCEVAVDGEEEGADPDAPPNKSFKEKMVVPFVFITFVVVRALDRVFLYRVCKSMAPFSDTLFALYWPPMVQIMCFLVVSVYLVKKNLWDKVAVGFDFFHPYYAKASEQGPVPQRVMAIMSFCDMANAMLGSPAMPFIPLVLQTPLTNLQVPMTAFLAFFYLSKRFKQVHYAGITITLISCITGVIVELQGPPDVVCGGLQTCQSECTGFVDDTAQWAIGNGTQNCVKGLPPYRDATGEVIFIAIGTQVAFYAIFIASVMPAAVGNVFKEKKLKQCNMDIMWAFFWFGMWQVFWGLVMFPMTWIPWPTPTGHNEKSPSTLLTDLADSWTCFLGTNPPGINTCETEPAWAWFMVYLLFNVFYNVMFFWLVKRLSATWATIGVILCGNLCGVMSQYALFAGESATKLTFEQWDSLALATVAMWVYNLAPEVDKNDDSTMGFKVKGDHRYDDHGTMGTDPDDDAFQPTGEPDAMSHRVL